MFNHCFCFSIYSILSAGFVYVTRVTLRGSDVCIGGVKGYSKWWNFVGGRNRYFLNREQGIWRTFHPHCGTERN